MDAKVNKDLLPLCKPITWFKFDPKNARRHNKRNLAAIAASLSDYEQNKPVVCLVDGTVIAGNGTLEAARSMGWDKLAAVTFETTEKAKAYAIADNRSAELADWDEDQLAESLKELADTGISLDSVGFDSDSMKEIFVEAHHRRLLSIDGNDAKDDEPHVTLAERFLVPPFSVLDARQGYWQDRKRQWLALGMRSELGRTAPIGGGAAPARPGSAVAGHGSVIGKIEGKLLIDTYRGR